MLLVAGRVLAAAVSRKGPGCCGFGGAVCQKCRERGTESTAPRGAGIGGTRQKKARGAPGKKDFERGIKGKKGRVPCGILTCGGAGGVLFR